MQYRVWPPSLAQRCSVFELLYLHVYLSVVVDDRVSHYVIAGGAREEETPPPPVVVLGGGWREGGRGEDRRRGGGEEGGRSGMGRKERRGRLNQIKHAK